MWIILGVLFSISSFALSPNDTVSGARILRVLPNNIILLNRGLEDGLTKNDHVLINVTGGGFVSRGICIKSSFNTAYIKLYRIPEAEAVSLDSTYDVIGINQREIPNQISSLRNTQPKIDDPYLNKNKTTNPFEVKKDLPQKLTERDLLEASGPEQRKLFVERALNQDQLNRDLEDFRVSLYASPFTRQSINEGESYRYGFRGGNVGVRYRLLTQFEQQQSKMKDPVTEDSVSTRSTSAQAQFVINEIKKNVSTLSLVHYNSMSFSSLGTPSAHWQVGPIGLTWHLHESKRWNYVDLSYVPLYDQRNTDIIENGKKKTDKTTGFRHGLRFAFKGIINERVAIENLLWVRPFQDISSWQIETDNLNLVNDLKLIFNLSENLFFDYNFIYQNDVVWKNLSDLPETNIINSLNFRYDFEI